MSGILDRIDATLDGLCPCGAPPRDGSAYCGDDCVPNWRGEHTISDLDGTAMRWRPDLPLADFDDSEMRQLDCERSGYSGRHNPTVYERTPDLWHFRLDDGHRFVGLDLAVTVNDGIIDGETFGRILDTWRRLDRELDDARRVETYEPWTDALRGWLSPITLRRPSEETRQRICDWLRVNDIDPNDVLDGSPIRASVEGITVEMVRRDSAGRVMVERNDVLTDLRTVPLVEPWPSDLHYDGLDIDVRALLPRGSLFEGLIAVQAEAELRERARILQLRQGVSAAWLYPYVSDRSDDSMRFLRIATGI